MNMPESPRPYVPPPVVTAPNFSGKFDVASLLESPNPLAVDQAPVPVSMTAMRRPEGHTETAIPPSQQAAERLVRDAYAADDTVRLAELSQGSVPERVADEIPVGWVMEAARHRLEARGYVPRHAAPVLPKEQMTPPRALEFLLPQGSGEWRPVGKVAAGSMPKPE